MAKKTQNTATKPVIEQYNISVLPRDRSVKEIADWKRAINAAESLFAPQRKTLYDLYNNVVLDTHVTSVLQKRTLAITNVSWSLTDKDGNTLEDFNQVLDSTFFEQLLTYTIESKYYGFSLIQIDWASRSLELVPREHVCPVTKLVLPNPYIYNQGVSYVEPPYSNLTLAVGQPADLGLLIKVAPFAILKRNDVSDWATFCEIFGMPMRVVYYDPSMPSNRNEADNALKSMGGAGYLVLPDGSRVEFPQSGNNQGNDTYDRFAEFCNAEISKAILGQTMTTDVGANGSRAQAEVHLKAEDRIAQNDLKYVERVLNEKLIPIIIAQGVTLPEGAKFQPVQEEQSIPKDVRLDMDLLIHEKVGHLPKDYFRQEYNVEFVDQIDRPDTPPTPATQPPADKQSKKDKKALRLDFSDLSLEETSRLERLYNKLMSFFDQAPK